MSDQLTGRALDADVARRVFEQEVIEHQGVPCLPARVEHLGRIVGYMRLPGYSTEIEPAWRVFVWLVEATGTAVIVADMEEWGADEPVIVRCGAPSGDNDFEIATTWLPMPEAVCRAALAFLDMKAELVAPEPTYGNEQI